MHEGGQKPGEGLSRSLLRDCEIFANLCLKLYCLPTPCSSCDVLVSRRQCDRLRLADASCMQMVAQLTAAVLGAGRGVYLECVSTCNKHDNCDNFNNPIVMCPYSTDKIISNTMLLHVLISFPHFPINCRIHSHSHTFLALVKTPNLG